MQNAEIAEKCSRNAYSWKDYQMPSGKIVRVQGDEPYALDILLRTFHEELLVTSRLLVPEVWWLDNGKFRRYYVDIFIASQMKMIEVKSTWTFSKKTYETLEKQKMCKALGYSHEIWIFDNNKKLSTVWL